MLTVTTALLVSASLATLNVNASDKTERLKKRLAKGDVIVNVTKVRGSEYPQATAMVVIDAAPKKVWDIVRNCGNYKNIIPNVASSKMKKTKRGKVRCTTTVSLPMVNNLTSITEGVHSVKNGKYVREWTHAGGDYTHNRGSWTLMAFDKEQQRTMAVYNSHVVPKMTVPVGFFRGVLRKRVHGLMKAIRKAATAPPKTATKKTD